VDRVGAGAHPETPTAGVRACLHELDCAVLSDVRILPTSVARPGFNSPRKLKRVLKVAFRSRFQKPAGTCRVTLERLQWRPQ
jgi:hypothetical protein